jgi:hypothetical protein
MQFRNIPWGNRDAGNAQDCSSKLPPSAAVRHQAAWPAINRVVARAI